MFVAILLFGFACISGGFATGQKNPEAAHFYNADPYVTTASE